VVVGLIANTTTSTGLKVKAAVDHNSYATGIRVTKAEMKQLDLTRDENLGQWNYLIKPRIKKEV
jgi:hypothetical protein